ncbi:MAG: LPS export ABC transporter permease LptG [Gammaproteobacteria bacterium]|nr:MAG: LPS export ABC transporter permease LptG [Pseudomonadota bacterium]PIE38127.1 MAG: LPS export ABC transporter permease LptG [Gammaproteobacteria bacterium]
MRKIDRYVVSTVSGAIIMVLGVVISLDLVFGLIAELEDTKNDYGTIEALTYVIITLPRRIYDYLPLAAFIGSLIGLGVLANNSELVVIRAAGVSIARIVWSAMKPAIVVVLVGLLLGEYIAPYTERIAQSQKAIATGGKDRVASSKGVWHRENNTFMHFNAVQPGGVLYGVTLYTFDENEWLSDITYAERGLYHEGQWLLEKVEKISIDQHSAKKTFADSKEWEARLSPEVLSFLIVKPDNLSISGLYAYSNYLSEQGLNATRYLMSFWKKLLRPITTAVLVLVAISFIFGPLRSVTMGFRVFTGIIVGLLFKYMQDLLGPSSLVFGFNPIWATLVPIIICSLVGIILMRRAG